MKGQFLEIVEKLSFIITEEIQICSSGPWG